MVPPRLELPWLDAPRSSELVDLRDRSLLPEGQRKETKAMHERVPKVRQALRERVE